MNVSRNGLVDVLVGLGVSSATDWDAAKCQSKLNAPGGMAKYLDVGQTIPDATQSKLFNDIVAAQTTGETVTVTDDVIESTTGDTKPPSAPGAGTTVPKRGKSGSASKSKPATKSKPAGGSAKSVPATKPAAVGKNGKTGKPKSKPVAKSPPSTAVALAKRVAVQRGSAKPTAKTGKPKPAGPVVSTGGRALIPLPAGMVRNSYAARTYLWKLRHGKRGYADLTKNAVTALAIVGELKNAGKNKVPKPITKEHLLTVICEKFPEKKRDSLICYVNNMVPTRLRRKFGIHVHKVRTEEGPSGYYIVGDGRTPQAKVDAGK